MTEFINDCWGENINDKLWIINVQLIKAEFKPVCGLCNSYSANMSVETAGKYIFVAGSTVGVLLTLVCMFTGICSFPLQCLQTDGAMVTSQGGTVVTELHTFCFCEFMYARMHVCEPSSHSNYI